MSDQIKLVSLDNIKIVKNYIDKVRGELSSQIDYVTEQYLNEQLDDAKNAILNAYEEDSRDLRERIAYVEAFGQEYEGQLQELKLQQESLQGDFEHKNNALIALQTQLDILSGNYDELYNDITSGAIFNSGELNDIIKTAMINEVQITENTILTPEMYASKVVALIANFGSVKAANIESGVIAGSTLKSTNNIAGTNKPVWIIDNDGSGYFAKENIKWTRDGDVIFGPDVKLSWSSISDGDSAVQSVLNDYDDYIQNNIEDNVKRHTENLAVDTAEVLATSLIDHTELDGNHIATPSLLAKKIVGAIGTFGTIKADKIAGTTIQGYTISAPNTVIDDSGNVVYTDDYEYETDESGNPIVATNSSGTPIFDANGNKQYVIATKINEDGQYVPKKIPAVKDDADISWALKADGSGWLANHNIEWTDSGTVTFGPDVELKWDNIVGKPEINDDGSTGVPGEDGVTPQLKIEDDYWYVSYDNGETWTKLNKATGEQGPQGPTGTNGIDGLDGKDGISITWLAGEFYSHPENPVNGNAYYNIADKKSYIYQDGSWYQMTIDGSNGLDGKDGTSIQIAGSKDFVEDLPTPPANSSDCYIIGKDIYIWDGESWYNGGQFKGDNGVSIIWKGQHESHISNPESGWAYYNTTDKVSYIWDGHEWDIMTYDGVDGKDGVDGLSIEWKGDLQEAPENPRLNWCYRDTDNGLIYIYNGIGWEVMTKDGDPGTDGTDGVDGLSVYITYHDNETTPNAPTGDGTTNGWHTAPTENVVWMSQKISESADSREWGTPIKIRGEHGQTPVIHEKYANDIIYNHDGTIKSVAWTENNGEDIGVYKGIYVDYNTDDSTDFNDYSWTMVNPKQAITTQLGTYKITSNTIAGKTIQSTKNTELEKDTVFETHFEDGTFDELIESNGTTEGPAWQLRDSGEGYLAQGNIRWDENGDVTFGEGVKLTWNREWDSKIPEGGLTESEKEEIISTVITQSGITAETITGKTIQSSEPISEEDTDPTWQITNDGSGYFAKKNIVWDETGKLTLGNLGDIDVDGNATINKTKINDTEIVTMTWSGNNQISFDNLCSKSIITGSNEKYYSNWLGGGQIWNDLNVESNVITDNSLALVTTVMYIKNTIASHAQPNKDGFLGEFYIENDMSTPIWIRNHADSQYPVFLDDPNGLITKKITTGESIKDKSKLAILIPSKSVFKFILHSEESYYRIVPISNLNTYKWVGGYIYGDNINTLKAYVVSDIQDKYYPYGSSYLFDVSEFTDSTWLGAPNFGYQTLQIPIKRSIGCKHKGCSIFINSYPNIFSAIGLSAGESYTFTGNTKNPTRNAWNELSEKGIVFGLYPNRSGLEDRVYVPIDQNPNGYIYSDFNNTDLTGTGDKCLKRGSDFTFYNNSNAVIQTAVSAYKVKMSDRIDFPGNLTSSSIDGDVSIFKGNSGISWMINVPEPKSEDQEFTNMNLYVQIHEALLYLIYENNVTQINLNIGIGNENGKCINEFSIPITLSN